MKIKNKDTKDLIIMVIAMVVMYICITVSQIVIVAKTFEDQQEAIQQELNNIKHTESIRY